MRCVDIVHGEPPLRWWVEAGFGWRKAGHPGEPPFVAMLAITVLAATLSDEVANIRSYYRTLRSLLRLAPGVDAPKEFDSDVQQLWIWLREWLVGDHRGALGLPTAYPAAGWSNVGWAMSQTVLSPLDRAKLPVFFNGDRRDRWRARRWRTSGDKADDLGWRQRPPQPSAHPSAHRPGTPAHAGTSPRR